MRKSLVPLLLIAAFGITLGVVLYALFGGDSPDFANFKRIQVGMSVDDVQAILGPGAVITQAEVPGVVRAENPSNEDAARREGETDGRFPFDGP